MNSRTHRAGNFQTLKGRGKEGGTNRHACFVRSLARIAGITNRQIAEGGGGINEVQSNTDSGGILDERVVKPCSRRIHLESGIADVRRF